MHMADALISPLVGGVMIAASAGLGAYSIKKTSTDLENKSIPVMGVMGAFIFAAQMINFAIPATGSSGHIGGGILVAAMLGPYAGFLTMAAVLLIQALFFADGGLIAYGCNVFNMGFYACMLAYPLIFKPIMKNGCSTKRIWIASIISTIIALQAGAFSVVLQTLLSGKTQLPFAVFTSLMQPIHLAIGAIEGVITACVISFVYGTRPEMLHINKTIKSEKRSFKPVIVALICTTIITGGFFSWYASSHPDGLEWSIGKIMGNKEIAVQGEIYTAAQNAQSSVAILPDYGFKTSDDTPEPDTSKANAGTSVSGIVGGAITLGFTLAIGGIIVLLRKRHDKCQS